MIVSTENLSKNYGKVRALNGVTLYCNTGEIVGLLGRNGAGKTTLFKILFGLLTPDAGHVEFHKSKSKTIGGIIEKPGLYSYLSAFENIRVFSRIQGIEYIDEEIHNLLKRVGLPIDRRDEVKNFSMGMKQRLGIAIALINNPSCLVLDEPFSGLDPIGITSIRKLIIDLVKKQGIAVIIASHMVEQLSTLCDRLYVISQGSIIKSGETQQLIRDHSQYYSIYGSNIGQSEHIKKYATEVFPTMARLKLEDGQISNILQELQKEQIEITSCVPEIDFENLFDTRFP